MPGLLFFMSTLNIMLKCCPVTLGVYTKTSLQASKKLFAQGPGRVTPFSSFSQEGGRSCPDLCWASVYPFKSWDRSWVPSGDRSLFLGVYYSDCFRARGRKEYAAPALTGSW